eukprot:TRINITY_DN4134_c0_g1_i1.p4 TRINITY_DN4134_c0_g1~~TRINITY_DN4134_c0_g1_i1.p4  ORF type:complete len:55 (-),score=24.79 TRINITY_DN4134_c0_g1_i1:27-191(-)
MEMRLERERTADFHVRFDTYERSWERLLKMLTKDGEVLEQDKEKEKVPTAWPLV